MPLPHRTIWKIAETISSRLQTLQVNQYTEVSKRLGALLCETYYLRALQHKLDVSVARNYRAAAKAMADRTARALSNLPVLISELQQTLDREVGSVPPVRDLLDDLRQAEDEFGELKYCPKTQTLSVATSPITLEQVYLGEFCIELRLDRLGAVASRPAVYKIVALDPHPATANDSVTHPHVRDEELCAGDATVAIKAALETGRICDFFILVRSVLNTYNSHSPYVPLDSWSGTPCHECGYVIDIDDSHYCQFCEQDFCDECASYCRVCDSTACRACLDTCPICEELVCGNCLTTCPKCKGTICTACLRSGRCNCESEDETQDPKAGATASAGQEVTKA